VYIDCAKIGGGRLLEAADANSTAIEN
ncbi:hypothetical protein Gpo141_00014854, partial [Globisporangium polare]